ncbi:MAG: hypothetical protein KAH14_09965, partial [Clostridiales bacterium]|nr:hypothetical protein [Clostridiales bacterium]
KVGAACISDRYLNVILRFMTRDVQTKNTLLLSDDNDVIIDFITNKDYLILPPHDFLVENSIYNFSNYTKNGGTIINFNYQIERGSLIYIEERINTILHKKLGG